MDNGKRITKSILKSYQGTTLVEIMITIALTGILSVGLMMISKSKSSFMSDSAEKYSKMMSLMLPIKKLKKDISMATDISIINSDQLKITSNIIRDDKLEKRIVVYKNNLQCNQGIIGKSSDLNKHEVVGQAKMVPCMERVNYTATGSPSITFLGISNVKWCKGGDDAIENCINDMTPVMPEEYNNVGLLNTNLSKRRFMAEFIDRTNRTITLTIDLGNLYDETLKNAVQITR